MIMDMLNEYNAIRQRLKGIEQQSSEFADSSESGRILLSISSIGTINDSANCHKKEDFKYNDTEGSA